jgi:hypothetical protein
MSKVSTEKKPSLLMPALRHYLFWVVDMSCALAGWMIGFGMPVKSWPALLFFMLVARWISFVGFGAHDLAQRRKQWEAEKGGSE